MGSVTEHYEQLLAEHYTWMMEPFDTQVTRQRTLFERLGLANRDGGMAVDLGCGPGFQSIALAQLGFSVTAVDTSSKLLAELATHVGQLPIEIVRADLRRLREFVVQPVDVIRMHGRYVDSSRQQGRRIAAI
ncbi:MAG: class I SAM-dependent methyltransferase [Candidatus Binataceae bacterium]